MHEGRVVEQGTFEQLCEGKGHYHRMLASQDPVAMIA
jgi:ABC-type multidrug transport system fused ATPase/permease subunit